MRPSLGRVVIYTRAAATERTPAWEYTARITAVRPAPKTVMVPLVEAVGSRAATEADEAFWEVLLAVDIHRFGHPLGVPEARGELWFSPMPVKFDPQGLANTWRWPERV